MTSSGNAPTAIATDATGQPTQLNSETRIQTSDAIRPNTQPSSQPSPPEPQAHEDDAPHDSQNRSRDNAQIGETILADTLWDVKEEELDGCDGSVECGKEK